MSQIKACSLALAGFPHSPIDEDSSIISELPPWDIPSVHLSSSDDSNPPDEAFERDIGIQGL
jgi:hypothetical protein